jgi:protein-S-isoprenylcysteine O-methyltransferase Ste14
VECRSPVSKALIYGAYAFGWGLVLVSTFLINHFDLFGLRQVWLQLRGRPYTALQFKTPVLYRYVRHPLYVGWFFAFWATPTMTVRASRVRARHDRVHPDRDPARRA